MGYSDYQDVNSRWVGYGVPAVCDAPLCEKPIDRGLGFKCEEHISWVEKDDEEVEVVGEGCGLYFCEDHLYEAHSGIEPKPDVAEWVEHMLTDPSWEVWRQENSRQVSNMRTSLRSQTQAGKDNNTHG